MSATDALKITPEERKAFAWVQEGAREGALALATTRRAQSNERVALLVWITREDDGYVVAPVAEMRVAGELNDYLDPADTLT